MAAVFDFTGGLIPAGATLARAAGPWSRTKSNGLVEFGTAANVARFDYDATTQAIRGLLLEPARTNVVYQTDLSDWQLSGSATLAAAAVTLPDGSTGGRLMNEGNSNALNGVNHPGTPISFSPAIALSIYVNSASIRYVQLCTGSGAGLGYANFDLVAVEASAGGGATAAIERAANGFRRISIYFPTEGGSSQPIYVLVVSSMQAARAAGSQGSGRTAVLWMPQVEITAGRPTTIIPAGNSTRAGDVLTLDWSTKSVADGSVAAVFTYADLSQQLVGLTITGGKSTVSTTSLNQFCVRSISVQTNSVPPERTATIYDVAVRSATL